MAHLLAPVLCLVPLITHPLFSTGWVQELERETYMTLLLSPANTDMEGASELLVLCTEQSS